MKLEVTVNAENKDIVKDFIDAMYGESKPSAKAAPKAAKAPVVEDEVTEDEEPEVKAPTKKAASAPAKKSAPAPKQAPVKKAAPANFADMSEDEQFEELKVIATRYQKKGHTADIKVILGIFGVTRITELDPSQYESVYDELVNYQNGMSAEDIAAQYE